MRRHPLLAVLVNLIYPLLATAGFQSGAGNAVETPRSAATGNLPAAEAQADFDLIDGGTFSTAADFCAVTHHLQ